MLREMKGFLRLHARPAYRVAMLPVRILNGFRHVATNAMAVLSWAIRSKEETNYTYDLTDENLQHLAHMISVVTGAPVARCLGYMQEAREDKALREHVVRSTELSRFRVLSDSEPRFARRLGWYALVRITRPKVVIETGIDKGLGSVLLCSALLKNAEEGFPGRYFGTDINPEAGWLLSGPYARAGKILYGDSIASLAELNEQVDLFINDSDHSADYEAREYETIAPRLSRDAIVLGDNAHVSGKLRLFSKRTGRAFLFFQERPIQHWYPGAGIGFSFRTSMPRWSQEIGQPAK